MKEELTVFQLPMTCVSNGKRVWVVGPLGTVLVEIACFAKPCDYDVAMRNVSSVINNEATRQKVREEISLKKQWDRRLRELVSRVHGKLWNNRIDGSVDPLWTYRLHSISACIRISAKRGSNMRDQYERCRKWKTWDEFFRKYTVLSRWYKPGGWKQYCTNLASNIRKRFRSAVADKYATSANGRNDKGERFECNANRSGDQMLFDW